MPNKFDAEALTMAAATLPRATEVNTIDDCTVDGNTHKNKIPRYNSGVTSGSNSGRSTMPSTGNIRKVHAITVRCKRQ